MLSQCGVRGVDLLIFVTLGGVVEFDFSRPLRLIDELVSDGVLRGNDVVAQRGHSSYIPKNYSSFDFVDGDAFESYIDRASLVICHGGVSSLVSSMRKGKKVIGFPRLSRFNEHLDDHQVEIVTKLADCGQIMLATDKQSLSDCLLRADTFVPVQFKSDNSLMVNVLIDFIECGTVFAAAKKAPERK